MPQLDLKLPARQTPGRPAKEITVAWVRELGTDDLRLALTSESHPKPYSLQRIRAVHHNIAILLSQGKPPAEVSRITGRSMSNLTILQRDPAFRNLLAHYQKMGQEALADVYQQLSDTGQAALAALQEKLETNPDAIDDKVKVQIVEMAMDRTGHGPSRTVKSLNVSGQLKDLVEKRQQERKGKVIDAETAPVPSV